MVAKELILWDEDLPEDVLGLLNITLYSTIDTKNQKQYVSDSQNILIKGFLLKKNWLNSDQKRLFELYPTGLIKYFEVKGNLREYKGSTRISSETILQLDNNSTPATLKYKCEIKKKVYTLV